MNDLQTQINSLKEEIKHSLSGITEKDDLEQIRIAYLGRHGKITDLMTELKKLSVDQKRILGPQLNELKIFANQLYEQKETELEQIKITTEREKQKHFDVTAYHSKPIKGSLHIYTRLIEQLENIFISMGYDIADGLEVETDYYNFEALNIPKDHPARDIQDTFWLNLPNLLLRTHTSPVQVHAMETQKPPIAVFAPGRCYRNEAIDASHDIMFTQAEGLLIGKNISISHLLATAKTFLQAIFEKNELAIRVRPGYFPFVEPGVEIDAECPFCTKGCSVCKKTRWIELLGSGLIHPNVLRCSGIDPEKYSGFAFGFGLERIAMIKYGIHDIRLFHGNKIEFLKQF